MWRTQWDDDWRANFREPERMSYRQLAHHFGTTKGSVINAARRLGLAKDYSKVYSRKRGGRRRDQIWISEPPLRESFQVSPAPQVEPILPIVKPPTPAKRTSPIASVVRGAIPYSPFKTCQWIESNHNHDMCGAKTMPGTSWCAEHRARVFVSRPAKGRTAST